MAAVLSNRQRKLNSKRIRTEQAGQPKPIAIAPQRKAKDEYLAPAPADGETIVHKQGKSGRAIAVRLDPLMKLADADRITPDERAAGEAFLAIVQAFFVTKSSLSRIENEATAPLRSGDPIRLYAKGRRTYVSTQRPRIISAPRSSSDGWSDARLTAMDAVGRCRKALRNVDGDALRALYALVIHPNKPDQRPTTLRAYVISQYGYRNQHVEDAIVARLRVALAALHKGLGIQSGEIKQAA